ncbi:hypothetical protein TRIP_E280066 [uncultured Spirochaetota bacterium]|nr:hypothetical protein TRIP_E280066 [uncultured Spirochaetota bacterium]
MVGLQLDVLGPVINDKFSLLRKMVGLQPKVQHGMKGRNSVYSEKWSACNKTATAIRRRIIQFTQKNGRPATGLLDIDMAR